MSKLNLSEWKITFTGIGDEKKEASIPTLLAIGNGRLGIRGTTPELCQEHTSGTFIAGFFDQLPRPELDPDTFTPFLVSWSHMDLVRGYHLEAALVNAPDPLDGYYSAEGERFVFDRAEGDSCIRTLNMRNGEFTEELPLVSESGKKARLTRRRFADMQQENIVREKCTFVPLNFSGDVTYHARINADVANTNISGIYLGSTTPEDRAYLRLFDVVRHNASDGVYMQIRGRVDGMFAHLYSGLQQPVQQKKTEEVCVLHVAEGAPTEISRVALIECDTIPARGAARELFRQAREVSYDEAMAGSRQVWEALWNDSDIQIEGNVTRQAGIRHSIYHLLIAGCRSSDRVSVAAKGLCGEGYRGMVFWDTDIHMHPFYTFTQPQVAKNIVSFRYNTLDGAREKAKRYGNKGASYPWETGISGREECESFLKLLTHQLHITADVVYAISRYLDASDDREFYFEKAAEVYIETARFWVSKGVERDGKFGILQASGPDELHLECDNNAYINNMAAYNLSLAAKAIEDYRRERPRQWQALQERIGLTEEEIAAIFKYKDCMRSMKNAAGVYEQYEGFFDLRDEIVFEDNEYLVPADTQTVKQADVLMLLYLLPWLTDEKELQANWDYYEPRTTHTSSLSYGVHGILAAQLGLKEKADYYLDRSLGIDLMNEAGSCPDGAHLAANGMSWSAIVNGIAGVTFDRGTVKVDPRVKEGWDGLSFKLKYRGSDLKFLLKDHQVQITNLDHAAGAAALVVGGEAITLRAGETVCRSY